MNIEQNCGSGKPPFSSMTKCESQKQIRWIKVNEPLGFFCQKYCCSNTNKKSRNGGTCSFSLKGTGKHTDNKWFSNIDKIQFHLNILNIPMKSNNIWIIVEQGWLLKISVGEYDQIIVNETYYLHVRNDSCCTNLLLKKA